MAYDARDTPVLANDSAVRLIVVDTALLPHVGDVLGKLVDEGNWELVNDPIEDITDAAWDMLEMYYQNSLVGQIASFVSDAPVGWLELDGTTYDKDDYPELYAKLPAGWQVPTQFTLPDVEDVFLAGVGAGGVIGAEGGANSYALTIGQLPSHTHTEIPALAGVDVGGAGPPLPSATVGAPVASGPTGDGGQVDNMPSYLALVVAIYAGRI